MRHLKTATTLTLLGALTLTGCATSQQLVDDIASSSPTTTASDASTSPGTTESAPTADAASSTEAGTALDSATYAETVDALEHIETLPDIPSTDPDDATYNEQIPKYDRVPQFGQAWSDDQDAPGGHNGCDTRNDVLAAQLDNIEMRDNSDCVVASGTYIEPYFGTEETFVRGEDTATQDEIDHVFPLSLGWRMGAWQWDQDKRVAFANDLDLNLQVTTRAVNSGGHDVDNDTYNDRKDLGEYPGKSDLAGYQWIEWITDPNRACQFASKYTLTAQHYELPILEQDKAAFQDALTQCQ